MVGSEADDPSRHGSGTPSPYHELGRPQGGEPGAGAPGSGQEADRPGDAPAADEPDVGPPAAPPGSLRGSWAPVSASLAGSLQAPGGWRWVVTVIRIAVAKVALDFLEGRHLMIQIFLVPVGLATAIWWHRWFGITILAVALMVFLVYKAVTWVIERLSMPRHVRKTLDGAKGEIRTELESLGLPTGPVSGVRFAWRLARGKHPRSETVARMQEGARRIGPIVSRALTEAGVPPPQPPPDLQGPA